MTSTVTHDARHPQPIPPNFESYSVKLHPIKQSARTKIPDSGINWKMQSYLRFADEEPANFADKYTLFENGCGTGCLEFCLIDGTTGEVYPGKNFNQDFPDDYTGPMGLQYRRNSRLLVVHHSTAHKYPVFAEYYVWDGAKLELVQSDKTMNGLSY